MTVLKFALRNDRELTTDANQILALSGTEALAWFRSIDEARISRRDEFNWYLLAEGTGLEAQVSPADDDSLAWAMICTCVYDRLAMEADTDFDSHIFASSSMHCRIAMMDRHGPISGDPVRDPAVVFSWFRKHLPTDYVGIQALLDRLDREDWRTIVVDVLRPLRFLKCRLNAINHLASFVEIPEDIQQYQAIMDRLP